MTGELAAGVRTGTGEEGLAALREKYPEALISGSAPHIRVIHPSWSSTTIVTSDAEAAELLRRYARP